MSSLGDLKRKLRSLSDPRTLHELYNIAGVVVYGLVQQGFALQQNPDGDPWKPSKAAVRENRKTLRKTGNLQDGITWKADSRGLVVTTTGKANAYASYIQRGTRLMVARKFMPEDALPRQYQESLRTAFSAYFQSRFG